MTFWNRVGMGILLVVIFQGVMPYKQDWRVIIYYILMFVGYLLLLGKEEKA